MAGRQTGWRWLSTLALSAVLLGPAFAAAPEPPPAVDASLSHSAVKGLTQRLGSALKKVAIFSLGTGSVIEGGALTVLTSISSYAIYVGNEYLWDSYSPNTNSRANNEDFDPAASFWQNTAKYLTLKPVGMAASWAVIYVYTGSWAATVAMGGVSSLLGPVVFYANNMAWDWYDWYSAPAQPVQRAPDVPQGGSLVVGAR